MRAHARDKSLFIGGGVLGKRKEKRKREKGKQRGKTAARAPDENTIDPRSGP